MHKALLLGAAASYFAAAIVLYLSLLESAAGKRNVAIGLALVGVLIHATTQYQFWVPLDSAVISFLDALSLCALVVTGLLLISLPLQRPVFDAGLVALPLAALVLLAEWALPVPGNLLDNDSPKTTLHVLSSVTAFGVLSIAGVYALFVALIDYFLRHHHLNRLVRALPALVVLEALLFRLITAGFLLLTVSLGTGVLYINDLFAQHLVHKTVLSMAAWLLFGLLLWGRHYRGWRGRTAVRLTVAGFALLALAYFGSKWVLEVVLGRSWQA